MIAGKQFKSIYLSISLTAIFAFSAAWWRFVADADVYIISIFFLLGTFLLILPEEKPRPLAVAAAHILVMFFHQLAVLFFPVVVLGIWFQTAKLEKRERILAIIKYAAAAFLMTFGMYFLSFYLISGGFDFKNFVNWLIFYAPSAGFSSDFFESLRLTFRGHRQLFFDGSSGLFQRSFLNFALLAIFIASTLLLVIKLARRFWEIKIFWQDVVKKKIYRQPIAVLCIVWIIPYLAFLFFFMPENLFYRLFYFPALVILIGTIFFVLFENLKTRQWRLALFALVFGLYNFLFYIQPNSSVRENTQTAAALQAKNIWSEKTVIFYNAEIFDDPHEANNRVVKYFNPTVAWKPLDFITLKQFEDQISEIKSGGGTVWLDALAIKKLSADAQAANWLKENSVEKAELTVPRYNIKFIEIVPKTFGTQE